MFVTDRSINFCGLSMDKTDHMIQYQTISAVRFDIRRLISFRRKKHGNEPTFKLNFQSVMENKKYFLQKTVKEKLKGWLKIPYKETRKNPQNMQELSKCVRLEKLIGGS